MVFVRNVKFSATECNSFNMRKKNAEDLVSKQIIEGSHAKKQPSRCKVATIKMQGCNHQDAKLHLSECKVTTIKMQFQIFSISIWNIFYPSMTDFWLEIFASPIRQLPALPLKSSTLKLHKYTVWVYIYAVLGAFYHLYLLKIKPYYLNLFHVWWKPNFSLL